MSGLPEFLAVTMGDALMLEALLLILFVFILAVRRSLRQALRLVEQPSQPALRRALWKLLRSDK